MVAKNKLKIIMSQLETPEFQDWFEGSKVVDKQNNPLRLYHGTTKDFDQFEIGAKGRNSNIFGGWDVQRAGIFFTEDPDTAYDFANQTDDPNAPLARGQHIKPVYLLIYDPIDLTYGFSASLLNTMADYGLNPRYYINVDNIWEVFDYENGGQKLIEVLKKIGYDGAFFYENGKKTWVAFDPNQVKSATGNRGTFDINNPKITAQINWLQKIFK